MDIKKYILIFPFIILTSCASHLPLPMDKLTGYFPASKKLSKEKITVSVKTKDLPKYAFLNLRIDMGSYTSSVDDEAKELINDAFTKIGFLKIIKDHELRSLTEIATPNVNIVDINNIRVLNEASKKLGRFLVAEVIFRNAVTTSGKRLFKIRLIDPYIGTIVFSAENITNVWESFQKELYYPVFNEVLDWYRKQEFMEINNKIAI